ncbi:YvrJ family protein [Caryophanon tenue]|nr:YvrJ family protein [Caryophanon tenue]
MEPWMEFISTVGFPVAIAFYLLHRIETKLDAMIQLLSTIK